MGMTVMNTRTKAASRLSNSSGVRNMSSDVALREERLSHRISSIAGRGEYTLKPYNPERLLRVVHLKLVDSDRRRPPLRS